MALYLSKTNGRNQACMVEKLNVSFATAEAQLYSDLAGAIRAGQVQVFHGDPAEPGIAVAQRPQRRHVGVNQRIDRDVREGADVGRRERRGPGEGGVRDAQPAQRAFADGPADCAD